VISQEKTNPTPRCFLHPNLEAIARCVLCGRFLCPQCRVVFSNRNYCRTCASAFTPTSPPPPYIPPTAPLCPTIPSRIKERVFPYAEWSTGEAIAVFGFSMLIMVFVGVFFAITIGLFSRGPNYSTRSLVILTFIASSIFYSLLLLGISYSIRIRHNLNVRSVMPYNELALKSALHGALLGIPLFASALLIEHIGEKIIGKNQIDILSKSFTKGIGVFEILILFFTIVVLAPICEEIFFRGYLYPAMRNRMDPHPAMILNGAIFAAVHIGDVRSWAIGFIPRFLVGYFVCYLFEKYRTITGPIATHATYNGLILLLASLHL